MKGWIVLLASGKNYVSPVGITTDRDAALRIASQEQAIKMAGHIGGTAERANVKKGTGVVSLSDTHLVLGQTSSEVEVGDVITWGSHIFGARVVDTSDTHLRVKLPKCVRERQSQKHVNVSRVEKICFARHVGFISAGDVLEPVA